MIKFYGYKVIYLRIPFNMSADHAEWLPGFPWFGTSIFSDLLHILDAWSSGSSSNMLGRFNNEDTRVFPLPESLDVIWSQSSYFLSTDFSLPSPPWFTKFYPRLGDFLAYWIFNTHDFLLLSLFPSCHYFYHSARCRSQSTYFSFLSPTSQNQKHGAWDRIISA